MVAPRLSNQEIRSNAIMVADVHGRTVSTVATRLLDEILDP